MPTLLLRSHKPDSGSPVHMQKRCRVSSSITCFLPLSPSPPRVFFAGERNPVRIHRREPSCGEKRALSTFPCLCFMCSMEIDVCRVELSLKRLGVAVGDVLASAKKSATACIHFRPLSRAATCDTWSDTWSLCNLRPRWRERLLFQRQQKQKSAIHVLMELVQLSADCREASLWSFRSCTSETEG